LNEVRKSYIHFGKNYNYFYRRKKITEKIDTFEMSSVTCQLAQNPEFRKIVKDKIAKIIRKHKQIIVEGRDTGTKIIPNAQLKIYLEHDYDSRIRNVKNAEDKDLLLRLLK
jgi:cytidylate kinase